MPWYFRRSRKVGPLRFTFSKSGISTSVGGHGFRVTSSARGTHLTVSPGGGVYYRERIGGNAVFPPPVQPMQAITSGPVTSMTDHTDVIAALNRQEARGRWLPYAAVALALPIGGIVLALFSLGVALLLKRYLVRRKPVQLHYELDGAGRERHDRVLGGAFNTLIGCQSVWELTASASVNDHKRHAGANQVVTRSLVRVGQETAASFSVNAPVWNLKTRKEVLYFLPDMVLVRRKRRFGSISYQHLEATSSLNQFRESDRIPADARVIGTTWRYANRDGGPDKRFANNTEIPIVLYGQVALSSPSGLRTTVLTSSSQAGQTFATAIRAYQATLGSTQLNSSVIPPA